MQGWGRFERRRLCNVRAKFSFIHGRTEPVKISGKLETGAVKVYEKTKASFLDPEGPTHLESPTISSLKKGARWIYPFNRNSTGNSPSPSHPSQFRFH